MAWEYLTQGQYNLIYVDFGQNLVLKSSIQPNHPYDHPKRSVRLWNLLNPNLRPPAKLHPDGWTCPFISGRQATDMEIHQHLIDIYQRTRRIVIDACSPRNMIYERDDEQVFCIDIGMAVLMDVQNSDSTQHMSAQRRSSLVSKQIWKSLNLKYNTYFRTNQAIFPLTIATIKALLVLRQYEPDVSASFLLSYPHLLNEIARFHDIRVLSSADRIALKQLLPNNLAQIKNNLIMEIEVLLERYGEFSPEGQFKTSCWSRFFRNTHRVSLLQKLIHDIHLVRDAESFDALLTFNLARQKSAGTCCPDTRVLSCLQRYLDLSSRHLSSSINIHV